MFGERLKALMKKQNMTYEKLAEAVGVSAVAIHNYGSGRNKPRSDIVEKLAAALNVTVEYLLGTDGKEAANFPFIFSTKKISLSKAARVLHIDEDELLENISNGVYNFAEARKSSVYISPIKFYEYTGWRY